MASLTAKVITPRDRRKINDQRKPEKNNSEIKIKTNE